MTIVFRPAAAEDINAAFRWYARKSSDLGEGFLAAVQSTLDRIAVHPRMYAVILRNTRRRALLHRFPYGIFYRVYDEMIVVVGVCTGCVIPGGGGVERD